jgi:hypothetical protein
VNPPSSASSKPIKAVLWGFIAGLPVGIIFGWTMHGLVGFILKSALFLVCLVIVIGVAIVWKNNGKANRGGRTDIVDVQWRSRGSSDGERP